jgi:anti-sigma regulatory factor (Ser/Thr protein kinase)
MARFLADLDEQARDSLGVALHELLMNAVEWGGGLDPAKQVRISLLRGQRMVLFRIADPGRGFRLNRLIHPTPEDHAARPEGLQVEREKMGLRPGGYGLVLVRAAADELIYSEVANEVVFIKYLNSAAQR